MSKVHKQESSLDDSCRELQENGYKDRRDQAGPEF